jgi:peptidoglycan/xylan/chitin deacetylase (PgdA/CDA1 family)
MPASPTLRRSVRQVVLTTLKRAGFFDLVRNSRWRQQRLLILCYHGIALDDENQWRPALYMSAEQLERRLYLLQKERYTVLPLSEALERLYRRDLPPRSVAITFDDGAYDFARQAYPRLKERGFPATVYLTSYYAEAQRPVFNLICSYMIWKARHHGTVDLREFGGPQAAALGPATRQNAADQIVEWAARQNMSGEQKNQVAARLATCLGIDYEALQAARILQIMNRQEVKELTEAGVDFQLHTHRHRTPSDEGLFRQEIRENRAWISNATAAPANHFCYPSGVYRTEFLPWLSAEKVISATTCDTGFATAECNPLLLPRLVDTTGRTDLEFESWICGVSQILSRKRSRPAYPVD